jgi:hypothetical protein
MSHERLLGVTIHLIFLVIVKSVGGEEQARKPGASAGEVTDVLRTQIGWFT